MPIDLISFTSQSQWCWRVYGNYSVVGCSGTVPWYLKCGFDSLKVRSALERVQQISLKQGAHRPDQNAGWHTAGRQGEAEEGMAWGYWPDGWLFWGGPLRWITWQFCELADGKATCAQCEMRYRQPTGLKYAAPPLRDSPVLQGAICLIVGCRGRQPEQKNHGIWVGLTRVQILNPQVFVYTSTVYENMRQAAGCFRFSSSHIKK